MPASKSGSTKSSYMDACITACFATALGKLFRPLCCICCNACKNSVLSRGDSCDFVCQLLLLNQNSQAKTVLQLKLLGHLTEAVSGCDDFEGATESQAFNVALTGSEPCPAAKTGQVLYISQRGEPSMMKFCHQVKLSFIDYGDGPCQR